MADVELTRFEYSPAKKRFTVHMVTRLHATFGAILSTEIHNRVKSLVQGTSDNLLLKIIEGIEPVGSSDITPNIQVFLLPIYQPTSFVHSCVLQ
jgi:hypothetical protein